MRAGVLVRMHMMSVEMLKRVYHGKAHLSLSLSLSIARSLAHVLSTNPRLDNQPK